MKPSREGSLRFQVGGALAQNAIYLSRAADEELLAALRGGEFCSVLAPRQIGKSSLGLRCMASLRASGHRCAWIDLTEIGIGVTPEEWYFGLVDILARELDLPDDPADYWASVAALAPAQRWSRYLRDVVLRGGDAPTVVFVDEIDSTLALPFGADDFFAAVRAVYQARARDASWGRLTFCLLGVATPSDLIRDAVRTPFNIGVRVRLEDFSREELATVRDALVDVHADADALVDALFDWVSGHPYMTQRLCEAARGVAPAGRPAHRAAGLVRETLLRRGRIEEQCLADIERRLEVRADPRVPEALLLYERILSDSHVPAQSDNPIQLMLRLSGIAAERADEEGVFIRPRNAVIATVFDAAWVRSKLAARRLVEPTAQWLGAGRSDAFLLRGARLDDALAWVRGRDDLTVDERAFVMASLDAARREEAAAQMADFDSERQVEAGTRARLLAEVPGREVEALVAGVQGVAPALVSRRRVPLQASNGLGAALGAARRSWPLRDALGDRVVSFALSRDGKEVHTASRTCLRAWSAHSGALLRRVEVPRGVAHVAMAPDGERMLVVTGAGSLQTRRVVDGALVSERSFGASRVRYATFSPDMSTVAALLDDAGVVLLDAGTLEMRARHERQSHRVHHLEFSPDGATFAMGDHEGQVTLCSARDGALLATWCGHRGPVRAVAFAPDGGRIVSASEDATARVWRVEDRGVIVDLALVGHDGPVTAARFAAHGELVVTGGRDGTLRVWSADEALPRFVASAHTGGVCAVAVFRDGHHAVTSGNDRVARIWDLRCGEMTDCLEGHQGPVVDIQVLRDDAALATRSLDGSVRVWRLGTSFAHNTLTHASAVTAAQFSPDGERVVSGTIDGGVWVWDLASSSVRSHLDLGGRAITCVAYSSDGVMTAGATDAGLVWVWDIPRGTLRWLFDAAAGAVWGMTFALRDQALATWGVDALVRQWSLETGEEEFALGASGAPVIAATYREDGSALAWMHEDGTVAVVAPAERRVSHRIEAHPSGGRGVLWTACGTRLVTYGVEGPVRVWDASAGALVAELKGHAGAVTAVLALPGGNSVHTAGADGRVICWDIDTGAQRSDFRAHSGPVHGAVPTPRGDAFATFSTDGEVRVWGAQGEEIVAHALRSGAVTGVGFSRDGRWLLTQTSREAVHLFAATPRACLEQAAQLLASQPEHAQVGELCALALAAGSLDASACTA